MKMVSSFEATLLRDVLDEQRTRSITDENRAAADSAIVSLLKAGYLRYRPQRAAQRFSLTWQGREALAEYEKTATLAAIDSVDSPTASLARSIVVAASDDDVLLIAERK